MVFKTIKKLLIFFVPFVLLLALFFVFEPYNYLLVKGESWYSARALNSMRRIRSGRCKNIILGNSMMANLNEDYIEEVSGIDYDVLAYGGAALNESIDEFWYAAEHCELERAVIGLSFYTLNNDYESGGRFESTVELAENPLKFVGEFSYWVDAADNLKVICSRALASIAKKPELEIIPDDPSSMRSANTNAAFVRYNDEGKRQDIIDYAALISDLYGNYGMNSDYCNELRKIADYCDENGIELTFVIMNCNKIIWDNVIYKYDIQLYMDFYKNELKSIAKVYDFEFDNEFAANDEVFLDGFHLIRDEKLRLIRVIFGGEKDSGCMITTKEEYLKSK